MGTLLQDIRFAIRMLWHVPAFTLAAVSTLALGVGATTAIFSAANAALLRPLPYPNAQDLRTVRTMFTDGNVTSGRVAPVELTRLNDRSLPIERAAVSAKFDVTLLLPDNKPRAVIAHGVSDGFFELFGLPNTLGRGFVAEHYQANAPSPAVVISHRLWREVFNSDPAIVGKPLRLAEGSPTIVGVAARRSRRAAGNRPLVHDALRSQQRGAQLRWIHARAARHQRRTASQHARSRGAAARTRLPGAGDEPCVHRHAVRRCHGG